MAEAFRQQVVQRALPDLPVRGMAQIVPEGDGLGQVLIQAEGTGERAGDLGNLEGVGQPGAVVVPLAQGGVEFIDGDAQGARSAFSCCSCLSRIVTGKPPFFSLAEYIFNSVLIPHKDGNSCLKGRPERPCFFAGGANLTRHGKGLQ